MVDRILELLESKNPEDFELANNILEAQEIELSDNQIRNLGLYTSENYYIFSKIGKYRIRRETPWEEYKRMEMGFYGK